MNKILCSLGAIIGRANGMDISVLDQCVDRLNCDGYEFLMSRAWYDKINDICDHITSRNIYMPVFHADKNIGNLISRNEGDDTITAVDIFKINCKIASNLGCSLMVLHLWGGIDSDKDIAHNISLYGELDNIAKSYGIELTIENIVCNRREPMSHFHALTEAYQNVKFTFDTKMSEFHSQTEWLYKPEFAHIFPHVAHLHINDYMGSHMDWSNLKTLHIGEGKVDFGRFFGFIKAMDYKGDFTVEAAAYDSEGRIDFDVLNRSFDRIRKYL